MNAKKTTLMGVLIIFTLMFSLYSISGDPQSRNYDQANPQFKKGVLDSQMGIRAGKIYIKGSIYVDVEKNKVYSDLTLRNRDGNGVSLKGARVALNNTTLREGSSGNYYGTSRAKLPRQNLMQGQKRRQEGILLTINRRNGIPIEVYINQTESLKMKIAPVYKKGVNLTGPVNVSWNSNSSRKGQIDFAIINSRGEIVFEKVKRNGSGMKLLMARRYIPPNGVYTFRISRISEKIDNIPNTSPGSYINVFAETSQKHRTFM